MWVTIYLVLVLTNAACLSKLVHKDVLTVPQVSSVLPSHMVYLGAFMHNIVYTSAGADMGQYRPSGQSHGRPGEIHIHDY